MYIILPVHNRSHITQRFLDALKKQSYSNYTLILIDDGSTDDTVVAARKVFPDLQLLQGDGSLWWGGALQKGYEYLIKLGGNDDEFVLIANDDTEFEEFFLENALRVLENKKDTMLLATCFSRISGQLLDAGIHIDWKDFSIRQASDNADINCLSTRCLFTRVGTMRKIGGFRPHLLPHYLSDYEFTIRAYRKGISLIVEPSVSVYLDDDATGCHVFEGSGLRDYIRIAFSKRYSMNPVSWSIFVLLVCPLRFKLTNICRIWWNFLKIGLRAFFYDKYGTKG